MNILKYAALADAIRSYVLLQCYVFATEPG